MLSAPTPTSILKIKALHTNENRLIDTSSGLLGAVLVLTFCELTLLASAPQTKLFTFFFARITT
jgi:hypothetical protein